jgi:hypothetical protein
MKTNYEFPYFFLDLRNSDKNYLTADLEDSAISFSVDLGTHLIEDQIDVVLEIENTQTFFRKHFVISNKETQITIEENEIGTRADYSLLLVATQDGVLTFGDNSDFYERGDCIGILEKGSVDFEGNNNLSGLIKLAPSDSDTISYDLTSDWLTITLPKETYEKFFPWQKDEKSTPFSLASFGNGCIQFAILRALKDPEFKEKKWAETIISLLETKGYSIEDLGDDDVPGATNKILDNCIQAMIDAAVPEVDHEDTSTLS